MTKSIVHIDLPQSAYDVVIAPAGLNLIGQWINRGEVLLHKAPQRLLLISNPEIFSHYGESVMVSLEQANFTVSYCLLPAGEQYKTLESIQKIYDAALAHRLERSSALVALGGGVIGDMAGFAAATWMRGIAFVQLPTSLLAMVDASIGGKTGVNHPQGKNLIGAFHQPRLVLIDPHVLKTLPNREFRAGMAEVIKYGIIWDSALFKQLEAAPRLDQHSYLNPELIQTILQASCEAKAAVVSQDEKEAGVRAILNYGHTIGHAIESLTSYLGVNHGEAVAIGMIAAGQIAVELGWWSQREADRQRQLIEKTHLPVRLPSAVTPEAVLPLLLSDKKVQAGRVRFILPRAIGQAAITETVPEDVILRVLESMV